MPSGSARKASGARGTKRPAEECFDEDEPTPKKGLIGRALDAINPWSSSLSRDFEVSASEEAPLPSPETAFEPPFPIPTDPKEYNAYISAYLDASIAHRTKTEDEAKVKEMARKLNFNLKIKQQEKDWIDQRQKFIAQLTDPKKTPMMIFDDNFTAAQILYLMPPATNGIILDIQKEHAKEYKESLSATGAFKGVPDNLATKLTMLHFGLPIEPITMENVRNCSRLDEKERYVDKSDNPDKPEDTPRVQRIMWAEKPLEFLDKYDDGRSYGYPKLRIPVRRDLPPRRTALKAAVPPGYPPVATNAHIRDNCEPPASRLIIGKDKEESAVAYAPALRGGGEAPASVPITFEIQTGLLPTTTATVPPSRVWGGSRSGGSQRLARNISYIDPGPPVTSMRGGAGSEDPTDEDVQPSALEPRIYGYNGNFRVQNNKESFLKTALRLLEYDFNKKPAWTFTVDIYSKGKGNQLADITLNVNSKSANAFEDQFKSLIKPILDGNDNARAAIFIRGGDEPLPEWAPIEPCRQGMKENIRLNSMDGNVSYWKVPKTLLHEKYHDKNSNSALVSQYGINQCQPAFFKAMKLLLDPETPRPLGVVSLRTGTETWELGCGGMEATVDLWKAVCERAKNLSPDTFEVLEFHVNVTTSCKVIAPGEIGFHMTGSHHVSTASVESPKITYDHIKDMADTYLLPKKTPNRIKLWHTAEYRERDVNSHVIELLPEEEGINSIKKHLEDCKDYTNCIWWQPKFGGFTVEAVAEIGEEKKQVEWNTDGHRQSLRLFKADTKNLSADLRGFESFIILEAQSQDEGRRFVVTRDTTEDEWRMHVFDWLHSNRLIVKECKTPIPYVLDKTPAFGVSAPLKIPAPNSSRLAGTSHPKTSSRKNISRTLNTPHVTRMNRERIVARAAGKPKSQTWSDWMTEQHFQDGLQRNSWIRDQSVVEPGKMPAPPLFGASRELQLRVGSSMPTIYAHRLTPTDIKHLQNENQRLRNQVLERMFECPICDVEFEDYDKDKKLAHTKEHQKQLQEAGQCPSCGDSQWAFMTNDEKRTHFTIHQYHNESATMKQFYQDQHCPVCDKDLSKTTPEQVIHHCLEHAPGQLQYCDRCGLDEKDCNAEELHHHHAKCRLAEDRYPFAKSPIFCPNCGANTTNVTLTQNLKHQKQCQEGPKGRFCRKCGLNMTANHWSRAAIDKHNSHCRAPSGKKKSFCEKCRTKLWCLDASGHSHHQQTCRMIEPAVPSESARITELKQRQDLSRHIETRLNSHRAYLEGKVQELNAREIVIAAREKSVAEQQTEISELRVAVQKLRQSQGDGHEAHRETGSDAECNVPHCPIPLCNTLISGMTKAEFVEHIQSHTEKEKAPPLSCPLENASGQRCKHQLSLENDGFDLTVHYKHKLSDEEQAHITKAAAGAKRGFANLRNKFLAAKAQLTSDAEFIKRREQRRGTTPEMRTSRCETVHSGLLAGHNNDDGMEEDDQVAGTGIRPNDSTQPISATTVEPPTPHDHQTPPAATTTPTAPETPVGMKIWPRPTTENTTPSIVSPPQKKLKQTEPLPHLPSLDDDMTQDDSESIGAEVNTVREAKEAVAKPARENPTAVDSADLQGESAELAPTPAGTAQKAQAAPLCKGRGRRRSLSLQNYRDLTDSISSIDSSENMEVETVAQKKSRPRPGKATPMAGKKRKQAEEEKEEAEAVVKNTGSKVSKAKPVKKKQKKLEENKMPAEGAGLQKAKARGKKKKELVAARPRTPRKRATKSSTQK